MTANPGPNPAIAENLGGRTCFDIGKQSSLALPPIYPRIVFAKCQVKCLPRKTSTFAARHRSSPLSQSLGLRIPKESKGGIRKGII